jgi:glycosyltransferase involved in cell wall biosynthesis
MAMTVAMARRSGRGFLRHGAYLVEACCLLRISRRSRIRHVHVHFGTNAAAVARLLRCLGGPTYSLTIHGPDEFDAPQSLSLAAKFADALFVVAITDYCAAQIRRWMPYEQWSKIHIVHCTVDESFFDEAQPVDPASRTFVCVGRLIVTEGIDARLVLAGDGELRPQIERRIAELRLQDRVQITGWIDESEVRRRLLESRALVLPSFAEGLPVVIMEAFALGRAVVSTTIAGIPELVVPEENGWLVPAGNVAELVAAMRAVIDAPPERLDEMGRCGQSRVRQSHLAPTEALNLLERLEDYLGLASDDHRPVTH